MNGREIDVLARTIYGEGRGESYKGKVAIAWVILNRANNPRWWGQDIISVCLCPSQFSMWNTNDPNRIAAMGADVSDPSFRQCLSAALAATSGMANDPTGGADHYHHRSIKTSWSEGQRFVSIGNHRFYNLRKVSDD